MPCYSLPGAVKNSPLQTTSPTTYLIPSIFAIPNLFCSLISVIHIAKASPATTGFLNLCLSQQKKFSLKPPTSGQHKEFYLSWYIPQSTRCTSLITFSKREYSLIVNSSTSCSGYVGYLCILIHLIGYQLPSVT